MITSLDTEQDSYCIIFVHLQTDFVFTEKTSLHTHEALILSSSLCEFLKASALPVLLRVCECVALAAEDQITFISCHFKVLTWQNLVSWPPLPLTVFARAQDS